MGKGTEVAMESAGITLMDGDLLGIDRALALSLATSRNIRENLCLRIHLQYIGNTYCGWYSLPVFRAPAESHAGQRRNEPEFGVGHR